MCALPITLPSPKEMIEAAVEAGHFNTVKWLFRRFDFEQLDPSDALDKAAMSGEVKMLRFFCVIKRHAVYAGYLPVATQSDPVKAFDLLPRGIDSMHRITEGAVRSGNLALVTWCIEEADGWSQAVFDSALQGSHNCLQVLEYLFDTAKKYAAAHDTDIKGVANVPWTQHLLHSLPRKQLEVMWFLENFPESSDSLIEDDVQYWAGRLSRLQRPSRDHVSIPWEVVRAFLYYRPCFAHQIHKFPHWVAKAGSHIDFRVLEAIKHPNLFTASTLDCLLKNSRDESIVLWF